MNNNIELFINNQLCDINSNIKLLLNRVFFDAKDTAKKDAQYSFSITLPITTTNAAILNFANIEEMYNKFNRIYSATAFVGGVNVFEGNFKLFEVINDGFKGNLYLPPRKTAKEIFSDKNLNDLPPLWIEFKDYHNSVEQYNKQSGSPVIFPLVLYGVLPKVPESGSNDKYTPNNVLDYTVRLGINDLPPSINLGQLLAHIFNSNNLSLSGDVISDKKLSDLYMSYKSSSNSKMRWNYGRLGKISISGEWSNVEDKKSGLKQFEKSGLELFGDDKLFACDLLNSSNSNIYINHDPGGNVTEKTLIDANHNNIINHQIYIPVSGVYKVKFEAGQKLFWNGQYHYYRERDNDTGIQFVGGNSSRESSKFENRRYEIKLLRASKGGDFGLMNARIDAQYYKDNLLQNNVFDIENHPKYFPDFRNPQRWRTPLFVDKAQNQNLLLGFHFGKRDNDKSVNPLDEAKDYSTILAAKPTLSWDSTYNDDPPTKLGIYSHGYAEYNIINQGGEGDNDALGWLSSNKYKINANYTPNNDIKRGYYKGEFIEKDYYGEGKIHSYIYLNAGDILTIATVSEEGKVRTGGRSGHFGWVTQEIYFNLELEPLAIDANSIGINEFGDGNIKLNWGQETEFETDRINLIDFLPDDIKINDFIENVCKAFNLELVQQSKTFFHLNKRAIKKIPQEYINIDHKSNFSERVNYDLELPSQYAIGFTIDKEEQGYKLTGYEGGGIINTGAINDNIVEQKNSFSYNWYMPIYQGNKEYKVPIISKIEVWDQQYPENMKNSYTDLALRFWYNFNNTDAPILKIANKSLRPAMVTNFVENSILSYENAKNTLLYNFFDIISDGRSHGTQVEIYLTADEYFAIGQGAGIILNGDIYLVAEIIGYDATRSQKTRIKLIKNNE